MTSGRVALVAVALLAAGCSTPVPPPPPSESPSTSAPTATPTSTPTPVDPHAMERAEARLRGSVVRIVKSTTAGWVPECTGSKVVVDGTSYVMTARHCFDDQIRRKKASPYRARDLTPGLHVRFGIRGVGADGVVETGWTAPVTRVVVRYYPDVALLSVGRVPGYDAVHGIDYRIGVQGGPPNVRTLAFGLPSATSGALVRGAGTYLGRVPAPGDFARVIDLVGIRPRSPATDVCNYGASGALAVVGPDGHLTGPLGLRFNFVNPKGSNGDDNPRADRRARRQMEVELRRRLRQFPTICGYGVITQQVLDSLVAPQSS